MTLHDFWLQFTQKIFPRYKSTLLVLALALFIWGIWLNGVGSQTWWWGTEETLLVCKMVVGFWVVAFLCVAMSPVLLAFTRQFVRSKVGIAVGSMVISLLLALLGFVSAMILAWGLSFEWETIEGALLNPMILLAELPILGVIAYVALSASTAFNS